MKQILNGFDEQYYLTEEGKVYNKLTDSYLNEKRNSYKLKTVEGKYKTISLKKLYQLVYGKVYCLDVIENLPDEEWREIPDTEGQYFISNLGRCKSLMGYTSYLLQPYANVKGNYLRVHLSYKDCDKDVLVHKLVALCFLPAPERADYQIHHKNFDVRDNRVINLSYVNPIEHRKIHEKHNKEIVNNGKVEK